MASTIVLYWRDIPSQVIVKSGRKSEKILLPDRFQQAIDSAAMRSGASDTDEYLSEWRRGTPVECGNDLLGEANTKASEIEIEYPIERLRELIQNAGRAKE